MKTIIFAIVQMAAISVSMGQKPKIDPKTIQLVDPGVSVHNYKHPQKAQLAKKLQLDKGVEIRFLTKRPVSYKVPPRLVPQIKIEPFSLPESEMRKLQKSNQLTEIITKPKEEEYEN